MRQRRPDACTHGRTARGSIADRDPYRRGDADCRAPDSYAQPKPHPNANTNANSTSRVPSNLVADSCPYGNTGTNAHAAADRHVRADS